MSSSDYKDPCGQDHYRVSWSQEDNMIGPLEGERNTKRVNLEGRSWPRVDKPCWFLTQIRTAEAEEDHCYADKAQRLGVSLGRPGAAGNSGNLSTNTKKCSHLLTTALPPQSSSHSSLSHATPWLSYILFPGPQHCLILGVEWPEKLL